MPSRTPSWFRVLLGASLGIVALPARSIAASTEFYFHLQAIFRPDLVNQQMMVQGGGEGGASASSPEGTQIPVEEQFVLESEAGIANDELPVKLNVAPASQPVEGSSGDSFAEPPPQTLMAGGGGGPPYYETDREYFYGPDYVDEFIGQWCYDAPAMLMLQDANYNP